MAVIATGFFDGVHLGHRLVIDTLIAEARRRGEEAVVLSFWPHPRTVLQQDARDFRLLSTLKEKDALLCSPDISLRVLDFTPDFAALSAEQYLKYLILEFGASCVVLGYDTRFGSDRLDAGQIAQKASLMGLDAVVAPEYRTPDGVAVSSTRIRTALRNGDAGYAAGMLGRPYSFSGIIVGGRQLGRTIGFPTANTRPCDPLKLIPAPGVYATGTVVLGCTYPSMTNIDTEGRIETHIFDFDRQIYGLEVTVSFLRRLRDEMHFDSLDALKAQLAKDEKEARSRI